MNTSSYTGSLNWATSSLHQNQVEITKNTVQPRKIPTVLETYKNLGTLAEETYLSKHPLFKKTYQEECSTKLLQEMRSETTTPDWGYKDLP